MRGLGGDANMCDGETHTHTRTQPFIVKDNINLDNHVFDHKKCEQVYDAEAMWVTPESFHCLMIIYSSLIICEYSTLSNT